MADEHETFESAVAGSAKVVPAQCSSLRKNGFAMLKGHPCKIVDMSTSKTGKHGHAKVHLVGLDIFDNKKYEENSPSTHNMDVPLVKRVEYQLNGVSDDGYFSLMEEDGSMKEDIKHQEGVCDLSLETIIEMYNKWVNEDNPDYNLMAEVLSAVDKEHVKTIKKVNVKT
jgi:translation initiation factor 5A